jgi:hypothetical protein
MMQFVLPLSGPKLYRLCLLILCFGCLLSSSVPLQSVQARSQPSIRLSHTHDETLPNKFKLEIFLDNPGSITAYEGSLLFDTTRIEYRGIEQPTELATRLQREARLMADVYFEAGLSFGLFSPAAPNQTTRFANQSVRIASIYLRAEESGSYQHLGDRSRDRHHSPEFRVSGRYAKRAAHCGSAKQQPASPRFGGRNAERGERFGLLGLYGRGL